MALTWKAPFDPWKFSVLIDVSTEKQEARGQATPSHNFSVGKICRVSIFFYMFKDKCQWGSCFLLSRVSVCACKRSYIVSVKVNYWGLLARFYQPCCLAIEQNIRGWFQASNQTVHGSLQRTAPWLSRPQRPDGRLCRSFERLPHKCDPCDMELITCRWERLGQEPETMSCASIAL